MEEIYTAAEAVALRHRLGLDEPTMGKLMRISVSDLAAYEAGAPMPEKTARMYKMLVHTGYEKKEDFEGLEGYGNIWDKV